MSPIISSVNQSFGFATTSPKIIKNGLVLYLDVGQSTSYNGGTTWRDLSGIGINGTLINMNSTNLDSANGGSLTFDGTNERVNLGTNNTLNFTNTNAFSVSFWMNNSIGTTYEYYVNRWTYTGGNFRQWSIDNGGKENSIDFRISSNGQDLGQVLVTSTNLSYSIGWHNICGTWTGSQMTLYVDGVKVDGPKTQNQMFPTPDQSTFIGGGDTGSAFPMSGKMAQVSMYNRDLTLSEVKQNFDATRGRFGI